jgi:hypothetical protein
VSEVVEDMVAEAKSELSQSATAAGAIPAEQGAPEQS